MEIPGVGRLTLDESAGWYYSDPIAASALGGAVGRILVSEDDVADEDSRPVRDAVAAFLSGGEGALDAASADVFRYYTDTVRLVQEAGWDLQLPQIKGPASVWEYVTLGSEFAVERDQDGQVYVSVECECAWEPEHGLQLVFRGGRAVSKVGPFDGHLTNVGRDGPDDVVYDSPFAR